MPSLGDEMDVQWAMPHSQQYVEQIPVFISYRFFRGNLNTLFAM